MGGMNSEQHAQERHERCIKACHHELQQSRLPHLLRGRLLLDKLHTGVEIVLLPRSVLLSLKSELLANLTDSDVTDVRSKKKTSQKKTRKNTVPQRNLQQLSTDPHERHRSQGRQDSRNSCCQLSS